MQLASRWGKFVLLSLGLNLAHLVFARSSLTWLGTLGGSLQPGEWRIRRWLGSGWATEAR
ncbi:MAG: hypothetical protein RMK45_00525 [Armatimonadota bacterium]|nr:hypothetical protein [Armatimonadota bacterium]